MQRTLFDSIKEDAIKLGFVDVGVTGISRPDSYDRYVSWLKNGYSAGMSYLATSRALRCREDPRLLLPDARSIIVAMARYPARKMNEHTGIELLEKISTYAWGKDYHEVLRDWCSTLIERLSKILGKIPAHRILVDGGPLLERDAAAAAGLGWIGKNSCLISPTHGSFTFLAEILIGIDIPSSQRYCVDRCGSCHRCLDACPTGCILPDRTIDARRCVSYLTIENKGNIAPELREVLGGWIFGCDICQMVCPWNQGVDDELVTKDFKADAGWSRLNLVDELMISPHRFTDRFKGSPLRRAKWKGYIRNLALSFGYERNSNALNHLKDLADYEDDEDIRSVVAWAVERIHHE